MGNRGIKAGLWWTRLAVLLVVCQLAVAACGDANSQGRNGATESGRSYTTDGGATESGRGKESGEGWRWDIDLPKMADSIPQQILWRKAYVASYNKKTRQPNWVAWKLTADHADGDVQRPVTAWHEDKEVPQPRAYYQDYKGLSDKGKRWDRGHMCPAGDNKWDSEAMYESFLMTNACPQDKAMNSGMWNQIEMSCREWAKKHGAVYIICGPLFFDQEHDTIGRNRIPIPEAFFKVVACFDKKHPWSVGYICRNNEGFRKRDLYENSIEEVERITGIKFFK